MTGLTLRRLVYDVWELIRDNIVDDDSIDERQIAEWIHQQRAIWVSNELNKGRYDESYIQDLGAIELEVIDTGEVYSSTSSGLKLKRTSVDIPKGIEVHNATGLVSVGPLDFMNSRFPIINIERAKHAGNGRFNTETIYSFLRGDRVYLVAGSSNIYISSLKYVNIRGIFDNPEDVADFTDINGNAMFSWDDHDYPINRKLYTYLKGEILNVNVRTLARATEDDVNNADNDEA